MTPSQKHSRTRGVWLFLCVLTLLASAAWLGLHWPFNSFWYDETTTAYMALQPWPMLWHWATTIDLTSQLPLYLAGMKLWVTPFAASPVTVIEFALRSSSVFFAFLSLAGILALGKRLAGSVGGVAAALLLAMLPAFMYIAFEVRVYGFTFAAAIWSYVLLWHVLACYGTNKTPLDHHFRRDVILYALSASAALYGHYTALLIFPVHALCFAALIVRNARQRIGWKRPIWIGVIAALLIGIAYAPWLPLLLQSTQLTHLYFDGQIPFDQIRTTLLTFAVTGHDQGTLLTPSLDTGLLVLLGISLGLSLIVRRKTGALLFALTAALVPFTLLTLIVLQHPKLTGRYVWGMWIGLVLIGALGAASLRLPRRFGAVRWLPPLIVPGVMMAALWLSGSVSIGHNSDFRGAFAYIRDHWAQGDLVVLRDGTLFTAAGFYDSPRPYLGLPNDPITDTRHVLYSDDAAAALRQQPDSIRRVWLVAWQGDVMDPQAATADLLETLGSEQIIGAENSFGDVSLDLFGLTQPFSMLQAPAVISPAKATLPLPDGLTLQSTQLLADLRAMPGSILTIHSAWVRRDSADNDLRVSIRLIGADGKTYSQIDQPPAGWLFLSDKWTVGRLVLGRYQIIVPDHMPMGAAKVQIVVYSSVSSFSAVTLDVGSVVL